MSNVCDCFPSLTSLTSAINSIQMPSYPKLKEEQLIHRPNDLGVPDLSKNLIVFYSRIINNNSSKTMMMKKKTMYKYIDLFGDVSADEYILQLTCQQMRGFIKKLMNVLTEKNNKYHETIGFILADWVIRIRPKFKNVYDIDIFHEIPIAENLRKIPELVIDFPDVFIALGMRYIKEKESISNITEQECHVIPP